MIEDEVFKQILKTLYNVLKKYTKITDEKFVEVLSVTTFSNENQENIIKSLLNTYNIVCLKKEYYEVNAVIQQQEAILKKRIEELKKPE